MARCEVCGNDYDKAFTVTTAKGEIHTFDSFECAVHELAPTCTHCGCRIIGHGVEDDGIFFCCAHCAQETGVTGVDDRV
jgi:Rieske Fe-S protein